MPPYRSWRRQPRRIPLGFAPQARLDRPGARAPNGAAVVISSALVPPHVAQEVSANGFAVVRGAVACAEAQSLRALYDQDSLFRSRIVMERHTFGKGEYKYFADPLPPRIQALRTGLYEQLLPIANDWMRRLGKPVEFPATHQAFLHACLAGDQTRPTALLLRYRTGDYNRLHQDLYGPVAFPLQATLYLSRPYDEFDGGEVVLAEQRPRAQTRVHVLTPDQGDLLIFPSGLAPIAGAKGWQRTTFRHGVATVTRGERFSLGIVLHDAR
ncbi:MAG: 2OG-Fe(II) oxygenase [Candidatus Eremiobacteraeota bacterium]|nr:2OG-Fe(II) oxygenase [Candidatus Eremiobacteraeota bacterium]